MKDNGYKEILLKKIIEDETKKAAERLGHFNNLDSVCANKDLPPEEFLKVLEGVLRNVIGICESRLKNTFSRKERYTEILNKRNNVDKKKLVAKRSYASLDHEDQFLPD